MTERIRELYRTKKKYFILAFIYLFLAIVTARFQPWKVVYWDDYSRQRIYDPDHDFYFYYVDDNAPNYLDFDLELKNGVPVLKTILRHALSLGVADLYKVYGLLLEEYLYTKPSYQYWETWATVFFPIIMMLKVKLMKRYFAKEKDKVVLEEPRFPFLYYRSQSYIAEIAADNIAFMITGILIKVFSDLTEHIFGRPQIILKPWEGISGIILDVIFLPLRLPFLLIELMMKGFIEVNDAVFYKIDSWLVFLIGLPIICLLFIALFEVTIRIFTKLYEKLIKHIIKKKSRKRVEI